MVTVVDAKTVELRGLSGDDKPVDKDNFKVTFGNGSSFLEIDTGKIFYYDAESNEWLDPTESN